MSYITDVQLESIIDLPVTLPVTELSPGDWLTICSFCLPSPAAFTLRLLQLSLLSADIAAPFGLITQGLGIAYLGLYKDYTNYASSPSNPLEILAVGGTQSSLPIFSQRPTGATVYSAPGLYSFVLLNNLVAPQAGTGIGKIKLACAGQIRLDLNPV